MPLPIAHSLLGATLGSILLPTGEPRRTRIIFMCGIAAILPDFDFLPVVLFDIDRSFHRGLSHSPFAAIVFGSLLLVVLGNKRWKETLIYTCAIMSHGLLDALTAVDGQGVGLLWPLTDERYKLSAISIFEIDLYSPLSTTIARASIELVLFGIVFWLVVMFRRSGSKRKSVVVRESG